MSSVRRWSTRVLLALAVVLLPTIVLAQGAQQRSSWFASATAEQGYDSNVRYESDSSRIKDFNRRLTGTVQATRVRARTTLGVSANASLVRYDKLKTLNAVSYDINTTALRRISANTSGSLGAFYRNVFSNEVVTTPTTLLFQRATQKSVGGSVGAVRRFSPFNTGTIDLGYTKVTFDRPGLVPGFAFTARSQFGHALRTRGAIGVVADVSQGDAQGVHLGTQSLAALVSPKLKKLKIVIIAGATRTATDSASAILPSGSVQVGDSLGPGSFSVGYSRGASQAFGLGSLLVTDALSGSYDFQARRGNFVSLGGWWGQSRPTSGPSLTLKSRSVFASFRRVLKAGVTIGGSGSYRQRKDLIQASGFAAQIGLGYSLRPR